MWAAVTGWVFWEADFEMKILGQKVDLGMYLGPIPIRRNKRTMCERVTRIGRLRELNLGIRQVLRNLEL